MPSWNGPALREARLQRGFSLQAMKERSGLALNSIRKVEWRMKGSDGALLLPRQRTVKTYCDALQVPDFPPIDIGDFLNVPLALDLPNYVDFRADRRYAGDPGDTQWRMGATRIGIDPLSLTSDPSLRVTVEEVRLGTDLFDTASGHLSLSSEEASYNRVLRMNHWASWEGGAKTSRDDFDQKYGHLGLIRMEGMSGDSPFTVPGPVFRQAIMFAPAPRFLTWDRFVRLWAEITTDIEFNLTVGYSATDDAGRVVQRDTLRSNFTVSGEKLQRYCQRGIGLRTDLGPPPKRGFPMALQPYVVGRTDPRARA